MNTVVGGAFRPLHPGMGQAVAERTILRKVDPVTREELPKNAPKTTPFEWETWGEVADRVAVGNASLIQDKNTKVEEALLRKHVANATLLMSGRHLQHGDRNQPRRNLEIFSNCATAATSFVLFYLLLNGSGVGRSYDDDMMLVNWDHAPNIRCVLDHTHKDFDWSAHESVRDARHKYGSGRDVMWFEVPDSREGWAKALEIWENAAFEKIHKDKMLILDFTKVRCKGSPIGGMQNRPASGPVPLMNAFYKAATLKGAGLSPWRQALYIDHYFAECVLVGGARRSARMSTKTWRDRNVLEFIEVKRPIEYNGMKFEDILERRAQGGETPLGFLWSSNNSVMVDEEFWNLVAHKRGDDAYQSEDAKHARAVLRAVTQSAYGDGTGEPGLINADKLVQVDDGWEELTKGTYVGSEKYQVSEDTELLLKRLATRVKRKKHHMITNPCGEIALNMLGGYCVIADVVPFHADTLDEAIEAFQVATRALIRVNTMNSLYQKEVARTNRIGVGMTGVHEFAWKFFKVGFRDLINPDFSIIPEEGDDWQTAYEVLHTHNNPRFRAAAFWFTLALFNKVVHDTAVAYSKELGVNVPHTMTTIKPAGTTSKLFGLTEGWHLPSMAWYVRWVQFRHDDPLIEEYRRAGYPTRELVSYQGTVIVGFPTQPVIGELGMGDSLVTAYEATPEEQYKWLQLGETYWINGVDHTKSYGNQISYTLKYSPKAVDYKHFKDMLVQYQSRIRACSVLPQEENSAYEYLPEESVTKAQYEALANAIKSVALSEEIGREHVDCGTGGCPIDFSEEDMELMKSGLAQAAEKVEQANLIERAVLFGMQLGREEVETARRAAE